MSLTVPNSAPYLNWRPIFEGDVVRGGFKNGYQKEMCSKEIGLCAPI